MTQWLIEIFNVIANAATVLGIVVALYVLIKVRRIAAENKRIAQGLEEILAPKVGIEGYLNKCAQVFEEDPDGTCVVADTTREIVLVNKRFEEMSGYHRSELIGKPAEIMVPDQYKDIHPSHTSSYLKNPAVRAMRALSFRHKRGHEVSAGIRLAHFLDPTDGYTIVKTRITDGG